MGEKRGGRGGGRGFTGRSAAGAGAGAEGGGGGDGGGGEDEEGGEGDEEAPHPAEAARHQHRRPQLRAEPAGVKSIRVSVSGSVYPSQSIRGSAAEAARAHRLSQTQSVSVHPGE